LQTLARRAPRRPTRCAAMPPPCDRMALAAVAAAARTPHRGRADPSAALGPGRRRPGAGPARAPHWSQAGPSTGARAGASGVRASIPRRRRAAAVSATVVTPDGGDPRAPRAAHPTRRRRRATAWHWRGWLRQRARRTWGPRRREGRPCVYPQSAPGSSSERYGGHTGRWRHSHKHQM
jgi:hypothetical protein